MLVVLAAGLGSRFGEGSKPLVPVGPDGETLPDYALYDAARAGYAGAVVVTRAADEGPTREQLERVVGDAFPVSLAFQDAPGPRFAWPEAVPDPVWTGPLPDREKPWGTVPAVLAARPWLDGPFVVANADDFYGDAAYRQLRDHLLGADPDEHALVAWPLEDTLEGNETDGFSRALCRHDGTWLERIVEVRDIRRVGGPARFRGITLEGESVRLPGDAPVSRNLWGFTPEVLGPLAEGTGRFLAEHGDDHEAEHLLSTAVDVLLARGEGRVRVLAARQRSFGVTYRAEVGRVAERIRKRVDAGAYPRSLAEGFRRLAEGDPGA